MTVTHKTDLSERVHLVVRKGDTLDLVIGVNDPQGAEYDFTANGGTIVNAKVKSSPSSATNVLTFTSTDASITLVSGFMTLKKTKDEMSLLTPGEYVYDIEFVVGTVTTTRMHGDFIVNPDIA